jgi:hypothetical protein
MVGSVLWAAGRRASSTNSAETRSSCGTTDVRAAVLRGRQAQDFREDVESGDPQELMARVTGNYRRGNERQAREHQRNRKR